MTLPVSVLLCVLVTDEVTVTSLWRSLVVWDAVEVTVAVSVVE